MLLGVGHLLVVTNLLVSRLSVAIVSIVDCEYCERVLSNILLVNDWLEVIMY